MRCPVCRATNDQGPQCRRCKADLSLLFLLEEQRKQALARALECGRQGDWVRLQTFAEQADALRGDEQSRRLLALGYLMNRRFDRAWACYCRSGGA